MQSAVLGSGGEFNAGAERDPNSVRSVVTSNGAVNTIQDTSRASAHIIEENRRRAPRGQMAVRSQKQCSLAPELATETSLRPPPPPQVERFGTEREIEAARAQSAQAQFIAQQQEAAALAQQQRARQAAPGDSSSAYTPSWNVAALSGEQPGPHPGLSLPSSVGSDGGAGPRRLRSRPSSVDETVATGAKPTALRGASIKAREEESFANRVELDAVYQKNRNTRATSLW